MDRPVNAVSQNLRRLRTARGLSVVELGQWSGVARATLTALEAGKGNPTLDTLYALATALDASLADLIADACPTRATVVRAHEGAQVSGTAVDARLLDHLDTRLRADLYDLIIRPGELQNSAAHQPGVSELFLLHAGTVRIGPQDAPVLLNAGDYVRYPADVPHLYEALEGAEALGTLLIQTPSRLVCDIP